jgi:hypothetical protein
VGTHDADEKEKRNEALRPGSLEALNPSKI